jgi:hypothetical protein
MSSIKGTNVLAPVVPFDTTDTHASHEARYGKGGYRSVADIAERDAIPQLRREAGMLVLTLSDGKFWKLASDLAAWSEISLAGPQGPQGVAGVAGPQGIPGVAGATGATGSVGPQGQAGVAGAAGVQGDRGDAGPQGIPGVAGSVGPAGPAGADGVAGPQGVPGVAGAKGDTGERGQAGPAGEAGAQGIQGVAGSTGAAGPANTLSIGTVSSGTTASATITGASPSQTLNLVLPKGDTGSAGAAGDPALSQYASSSSFPATGSTTGLYLSLLTSRLYRWVSTDSVYIEVGLGGIADSVDGGSF